MTSSEIYQYKCQRFLTYSGLDPILIKQISLTLILPKLNVISLCHQYIEQGQPALHLSDLRLFTQLTDQLYLSSHLDILKMKMDSAKNERWIA